MTEFAVSVQVRSYEVDANGHLNYLVYLQFGDHARTAHLRAAGCPLAKLRGNGLALVMLEVQVHFHVELVEDDEVEVTSRFEFGPGKTFTTAHDLRRPGSPVAAEIVAKLGLLDTASRRLADDPAGRLAAVADNIRALIPLAERDA